MGKSKFASYEEAQEALAPAKEELGVAKEELKAFRKEAGIKKDETPTDPKVKKRFDKFVENVEKKQKEVEEIKTYLADNKPAKVRESKYEYPEDCTSDSDRKKYRAKMRRQAAAGEPGEEAKEEKAEKKEKKSKEGKDKKSDKKSDKKDKKSGED